MIRMIGKAQANPSTLHMDGTSPVTVKVQATTDELRDVHNTQVTILDDAGIGFVKRELRDTLADQLDKWADGDYGQTETASWRRGIHDAAQTLRSAPIGQDYE